MAMCRARGASRAASVDIGLCTRLRMGVRVRLRVRTGARAGAPRRAHVRFDRAAFSMRIVGMEDQTAAQAA
ncbi:hypothetical protein BTO02_12115 [Paraburkholderia sp. SOS3]|jgi:hypothetical protein|nr:hypothetical protein BTO02_12115 [Paraburkholderia sp. SOS3]